MALSLADAGARVSVCARSRKQLGETEAELDGLGRAGIASATDLTDGDAVTSMFSQLRDLVGPVDILVNNAGIQSERKLEDAIDEEVERVLTGNVLATYRCCRIARAQMAASGGGKIVNVASVFALRGVPAFSAYAAAKGALLSLTRALAVELAPQNIQVNAINPGYFATEMTRDALAEDWIREKVLRRIPAGRVGVPNEAGALVAFLCSPAADYVTGATVAIDGGFLSQ